MWSWQRVAPGEVLLELNISIGVSRKGQHSSIRWEAHESFSVAHAYLSHFRKPTLHSLWLLIPQSLPAQAGRERASGCWSLPSQFSPLRADHLSTWSYKAWLRLLGCHPTGRQHRGLASSAHSFSNHLQTLAQLQTAQLECPRRGIHEPEWKT